ncbi:MAG TPA: sulfatase-like hydrolase/transferase, partial [Candidatus Polarisedimenticolia bacterium]|nr:sulfatase-like hydrolase/transferase [Candidatus Polarisedimenticolia bacterium]
SIVLILADNIGYGDLSCYGQAKFQTPNLDKLASEGIRFTSYYAGSPRDEASRASLFTGLEPRHIDSSFSHPLPMGAFTVAALLKETGYHTGLMGEWNLGDTPSVEPDTKGFMEFAGELSRAHATDYFSDNIYRQDTTSGSNRLEALSENWNNARGTYIPDLLGAAGANFIRINAPDKLNHYRAIFLCISYPIPHNGTPPKDSRYSGESWPQPARNRAAMIAHMDDSIGRVLNQLATFEMDTNTVVIFTSIGGAQQDGAMSPKFFNSSGPLRGEAGSVYEGGIRVPMIIRWPAKIQAGQVSDVAWAAWDLMPTLAEIALTKDTEKTDGLSILPLLAGKGKVRKHDSFYWQTQDNNEPQQAARMGDWKTVQIGTNAPELYNLKTDIGETNNVSAKNPAVLKKMKDLLSAETK